MRRRCLLLVLLIAAAAPRPVRAQLSLFAPRPVDNGAFIDLYGVYESDDLTNGDRRVRWKDRFLQEKLTLFSNGYFYHPRLLTYYVSLTGALRQESYESTFGQSLGRRGATSVEYDTRFVLLPEHPYNLEIFASRFEPLLREQFAAEHNTVTTRRGVDLRYRRRPWFLHARASEDDIQAQDATNVRKLTLEARYVKDYGIRRRLSLDATFSPARVRTPGGFRGDTTDAWLGAAATWRALSVNTTATRSSLSQSDATGATSADGTQLSVYQQVSVQVAPQLTADAFYRYQRNENDYAARSASQSLSVENVRNSVEVDLKHQLYRSLQSTYSFHYDTASSNGGETSSLTHSLGIVYSKSIPRGQIVESVFGSVSDTTSQGQTEAVDEVHAGVEVPGTFLLERPSDDAASVVVFVRSPEPPFELVRLEPGVHYTVSPAGNTLQLALLTLPPQFPVPGKYDLRVSYALVGGTFDLRLKTAGESLNLSLFDNLLNPYFGYNVVRSEVTSGSASGLNLDSDVLTAGLAAMKGPARARFEYQDVHWEANPYTTLKAELQLVGAITRTTNGNASVRWEQKRFAEVTDGLPRPAYTETTTSAAANLQQLLFSRRLSLSAGGSYAKVTGLNDSRAFSVSGALSWKIGKLEISGSASYTDTDTRGGSLFSGRRVHQYYYLKVRRTLF